MKKCWLYEWTGETREVIEGEWYCDYGGDVRLWHGPKSLTKQTIYKITEFSSNPLEPLKEVGALAETALTAIELLSLETRKWDEYKDLYKLAKAISEAMKRMEGK